MKKNTLNNIDVNSFVQLVDNAAAKQQEIKSLINDALSVIPESKKSERSRLGTWIENYILNPDDSSRKTIVDMLNRINNDNPAKPNEETTDKNQSARFEGISFAHINNDAELCVAIENLLNDGSRSTYPSVDSHTAWIETEVALLQSLCLYIKHYFSEQEHNLEKVMFMMQKHQAEHNNKSTQLDKLMETERKLHPDSMITFKYFEIFKKKAYHIEKSVVITSAIKIRNYIECQNET